MTQGLSDRIGVKRKKRENGSPGYKFIHSSEPCCKYLKEKLKDLKVVSIDK